AGLVGWRFARRAGWSFAAFGDLFAPALALGHAFGRFGCFAAGCCFGKLGGGRLGVAFPRGSVAFDELAGHGAIPAGWETTPALHPTQLYEAFGELALSPVRVSPGPAACAGARARCWSPPPPFPPPPSSSSKCPAARPPAPSSPRCSPRPPPPGSPPPPVNPSSSPSASSAA